MINPFNLKTDDKNELKFKKAILFFLSFIGLILLIFLIYFIININKTATIEILVSPIDATVKIGENTFNTNQTIRIEPGTYDISIKHEGFYDYNGKIEAKKNQTAYILECLPLNPEIDNYYKRNEQDNLRCDAIGDKKADIESLNIIEKNTDKIYSLTPSGSYSDGYKIYTKNKTDEDEAENKKITIIIYLYTCADEKSAKYQTYKQNALNKLKAFNINLDNYNIEYLKC